MSKPRVVYSCTACGGEALRWEGRCPHCGSWDALVEVEREGTSHKARSPMRRSDAVSLDALALQAPPQRLQVPFSETARVLGGGLVPGSVVLLAGEPGIGKSTLLLQIGCGVAATGATVVYVAGEESPQQIGLRAGRLGLGGARLHVVTETDVDALLALLDRMSPGLVLVDSVQTLALEEVSSAAGSVAQVRECAARLIGWAKGSGVPVVLAGHVTKDGAVAGPRVLEHAVDAVLYLEGESLGPFRVLRGVKNRFGSTNEVAILEMTEEGLREVSDPSSAFMAERPAGAAGSAVVPLVEGSRPLLVEVQALVAPAAGPEPRRIANGVEMGRLLLIAAVLSRRAGVPLGTQDVIVNAVGGLRVSEPAADLAVALAIASSLRDMPLDAHLAAVGEVGLTGEVRRVGQVERRLAEASRLGFRRLMVPAASAHDLRPPAGVEVVPVSTVRQALGQALAAAAVR